MRSDYYTLVIVHTEVVSFEVPGCSLEVKYYRIPTGNLSPEAHEELAVGASRTLHSDYYNIPLHYEERYKVACEVVNRGLRHLDDMRLFGGGAYWDTAINRTYFYRLHCIQRESF